MEDIAHRPPVGEPQEGVRRAVGPFRSVYLLTLARTVSERCGGHADRWQSLLDCHGGLLKKVRPVPSPTPNQTLVLPQVSAGTCQGGAIDYDSLMLPSPARRASTCRLWSALASVNDAATCGASWSQTFRDP